MILKATTYIVQVLNTCVNKNIMPESSNLKNRIILNKNDKANFTSIAALNCFSAESIRFIDMAYKP